MHEEGFVRVAHTGEGDMPTVTAHTKSPRAPLALVAMEERSCMPQPKAAPLDRTASTPLHCPDSPPQRSVLALLRLAWTALPRGSGLQAPRRWR
jgi:hypothetical protein